jgi:hypothetical protein
MTLPFRSFTIVFSLMLIGLVSPSWAGMREAIDAYHAGQYGVAVKEFHSMAAEGVPEAEFYLGVMYAKGRGVPQDYEEAVRWYRLAADKGYAKAMSNLGRMYSRGKGVPKDYAQAVHWYQGAAEEELPEAQYNLGVMYKEGQGIQRDFILAHMWFNLAAGQGHEDALLARRVMARMMTKEQISEAQRLARDWRQKKQGCLDSGAERSLPCP